ncbi:F-box protein At3g07870-like [Telopea speciosissima]|uniref:F-box protein At3g07870-like n=1 Tax=Telopea speciosissima TaxID=54955 RepID=UPI001CC40FAB|nr:F-box protein At3g07870-like [Telopea speciosissima]
MVVKLSLKRKKARKGSSDCSSSNGRRRRSNKLLEDLPVAIIFDIFSRLSAVTLIRLRSVCKFWNNLTRDSGFIDLHLKKRKLMHDDIPPSHLILFASRTYFDKKWSGLFWIDDGVEEGNCKAREIQIEGLQKFQFVGSCNGLICLEPTELQFRFVTICNPITGEKWCLPPGDEFLSFNRIRVPRIGFGFDDATGKYKLIRFWRDDERQKLVGEIISLGEGGEGSWRKLDIPVLTEGGFYYGFNTSTVLFLNGFLYWIITRNINADDDDDDGGGVEQQRYYY